jgi:hypothetical protein
MKMKNRLRDGSTEEPSRQTQTELSELELRSTQTQETVEYQGKKSTCMTMSQS